MGEEAAKKKGHGFRNGGVRDGPSMPQARPTVRDPRFARLHTDPRFQRLPKNQSKVSIDSRFAGMFSEKSFNDPLDNNKRGGITKSTNVVDPLRRYYKLDEEDSETEKLAVDGEEPAVLRQREKLSKKKLAVKGKLKIEDGLDSAQTNSSLPRKQNKKKIKDRKLHVQNGKYSEIEEEEEAVENRDAEARDRNLLAGNVENRSDDNEGSGLEERDLEEDSASLSSSSSESEGEVDDVLSQDDEEKIPTTNDETRRLAMMNMDWEHIRAVHLLVLMRSFVPKGGSVFSVSIYPSEFGIEQMQEESVHGPKSIFKNNDVGDDDDEEGADPEKLRKYEKAKLRYYYAVVDCDSTSTAAHLYRNCDGVEFERTSNTLDLRYIPDDMEFKRAPRDVAREVPADYKAVEFETRALQHSNVKLTWDDDEPVRVKALRRNFNRDELNEMDFRAYVGSSSESESDGGADVDTLKVSESFEPTVEDKKDKVRLKYLSLLAGTDQSGDVLGKKKEKGNIEIKFHTGLDELSEKLLSKAKKNKTDETVWESYLRKKKEKKNARKNRKASNASSEDDEEHSDGSDPHNNGDLLFSHGSEDPFDDPFFKHDDNDDHIKGFNNSNNKGRESDKKDTKKRKKVIKYTSGEEKRKKKEAAREKTEAAKNQADLELLLLDDHMVQNGEVLKNENLENLHKKKLKKGGKGKNEELDRKLASSTDYEDPRFSPLFTSHLFALDPTDPHFRKAGSHIAELQRKRLQTFKKKQEDIHNSSQANGDVSNDRKRKAELNSLVRSLKSKVKTKQAQAFR